jgi:hypothetical protein
LADDNIGLRIVGVSGGSFAVNLLSFDRRPPLAPAPPFPSLGLLVGAWPAMLYAPALQATAPGLGDRGLAEEGGR